MAKGTSDRNRATGAIIDDLRRVFQVAHGYSRRAERVAGLTGPQLWAVKTLAESAPVRVSDLARRMYLHPSTVVGILDRLESRGLATRTRSEGDRRVVTVDLTKAGREMVKKVPAVAQGLLLTGLKNLSPRRLRTVADGLRILVGILGAHRIPPQLLFSREINRPAGRPGPGSERSPRTVRAAST